VNTQSTWARRYRSSRCISASRWRCWFCLCQLPAEPERIAGCIAAPTLDSTDPAALCAAVTEQWGRDWTTTIRGLEALKSLGATCADGVAISNRLYIAYLAYGALLEQRGRLDEAIQAYQTALENNRLGAEAANRLSVLNVYTPAPPERCDQEKVLQALSAVTDYTPTTGSFVRIGGANSRSTGCPSTSTV
jgi:tetratricopeptide (TPR) repeat protein